MEKETIVTKDCVGCGKKFTTYNIFAWIKLYCTDSCESAHSIFRTDDEGVISDVS